MNVEEFLTEIKHTGLSEIVSKYIVETKPIIFETVRDYYLWREDFAKLIDVDSKDICFVGSASTGFSLNPNRNFKKFDIESDIDIAVISHYYFEQSWYYLRNIGTELYSFGTKERNSLDDHRERLIYWGTIAADNILHILPFGKTWLEAITTIKKKYEIKNEVNIRIYRDYRSLRFYHIHNLRNLKNNILSVKTDEEIIK